MIVKDDIGLYCAAGNFYVDPLKPCENAIITHAHADHARPGMTNYICTHATKDIMKLRIGHELNISSVDYEQEITLGNATVSFHSAGHILGSAQIKIKVNENITVITGDYKFIKTILAMLFSILNAIHLFLKLRLPTQNTYGLILIKKLKEFITGIL